MQNNTMRSTKCGSIARIHHSILSPARSIIAALVVFASSGAVVVARPNPIDITITVDAGQTKVYGAVDPTLTYTLTTGSLSAGDLLVGSLARDPGESVGSYAVGPGDLTLQISSSSEYNMTFVPADFVITPAPATVALGSLSQTYSGTPRPVTTETVPSSLPVSVLYGADNSTTAPTIPGSYPVIAIVTHPNYVGRTNGTLVIDKATASVSLQNLNWTYNGNPRPASFTTVPADLPGNVLYGADNSTVAPTPVGSYSVSATLDDPFYIGNATGTLVIARGVQTISFSTTPDQVTTSHLLLDATASSLLPVAYTVLSGPATLSNDTTLVFGGSGVVSVVAAQAGNTNWLPAPSITNTFLVTRATPLLSLTNTVQSYNGQSRTVTVVSDPAGLPATVTYNGSAVGPTNAGTYAVTARVDTAMYQASVTGSLVIQKGSQVIDLPVLNNQFTTNRPVMVLAASSGLPVLLQITGPAQLDGQTLVFTGSGTVTLLASQGGNANWSRALTITNTFQVLKSLSEISISNLSQTYDGAAHAATVSVSPTGLVHSILYNGAAALPTNAGTYTVSVSVSDAMYAGSATADLVVDKAVQTLNFGPLAERAAYEAPFTLTASITAGSVTFTSLTPSLVSVTGNVASALAAGVATIRAFQEGSLNWYGVTNDQSFTVRPMFAIDVTAGRGGTVTPSNRVVVAPGVSTSFTVRASSGYTIQEVYVDGSPMYVAGGTDLRVLWPNVQADGTLEAVFVASASTNGIPDEWYTAYGLTNGAPAEVDLQDSDGDGMLNWQEFVADTVPTNGRSLFEIARVMAQPGTTAKTLSWPASSNRVYRLDWGTSVLSPDFVPVATNLPGTYPMNTYTDNVVRPVKGYYRIGVRLP